jgi:hypothetical protein
VAQVAFASAQHFISQEAVFSDDLEQQLAQPVNIVAAQTRARQVMMDFMVRLVLV